ncbi:pimeloyl-ACP methyl ester esterase BioH [Candidatus Pantoea carbekii]|uniref:Pimeloyl-[acyl-carrier protein] methyl ester esterase n=1 Tax=Candidatus Pantoea carbekii TaxID=1235990 RepID=U3U7F8_9GAMM|nr:pimeloyl-ACP methyl ester esterase BioH [Candidatus Pantoea carbekii]AKC32447.1 carboxylesterase BioH [Candidatus Pantoea carbekii]BAO00174.1 BioH protein [Candidatus Pantoea carbekii]
MNSLYCHITGEGKRNLVLLHGWGFNAEIWYSIVPYLRPYFRLYLVDLPGFGRSQSVTPFTLSKIIQELLPYLPSRACLLGWSLGGLVATQVALNYPERVSALISVASSPCFTARDNWPGIRMSTLISFQKQLSINFKSTIERFLNLQTIGLKNAKQDAFKLKTVVLAQPMPPVVILQGGLNILQNVDLRSALPQLTMPFLRLYGSLDGLVPRSIAAQLDAAIPNSPSIVIPNAAHAPFISHPDIFCQHIFGFAECIQS